MYSSVENGFGAEDHVLRVGWINGRIDITPGLGRPSAPKYGADKACVKRNNGAAATARQRCGRRETPREGLATPPIVLVAEGRVAGEPARQGAEGAGIRRGSAHDPPGRGAQSSPALGI